MDSAFYFIDMELCQANLEEYTLGKEVPGLESWTAAVATKSHARYLVDIIRQICDGLIFIHSHNEVHRDLNPQNGMPHISSELSRVLFSCKSGCWKIADFGLTSTALTSQAKTTQQSRGKPGYRAPELLQYPKSTYNEKADIWSLGCILHELATSESAFHSDTATFEFAM